MIVYSLSISVKTSSTYNYPKSYFTTENKQATLTVLEDSRNRVSRSEGLNIYTSECGARLNYVLIFHDYYQACQVLL